MEGSAAASPPASGRASLAVVASDGCPESPESSAAAASLPLSSYIGPSAPELASWSPLSCDDPHEEQAVASSNAATIEGRPLSVSPMWSSSELEPHSIAHGDPSADIGAQAKPRDLACGRPRRRRQEVGHERADEARRARRDD